MGKIIDAIERVLFGATAQERVDMMAELAARRAEERIIAALGYDDDRRKRIMTHGSHALDPDQTHHRQIVAEFYKQHPELKQPESTQVYDSWSDVPSQPELTETTCIFVDGGIRHRPLDVGQAILINDGGIIEAPIACGLLHRDGGITEATITQRLM